MTETPQGIYLFLMLVVGWVGFLPLAEELKEHRFLVQIACWTWIVFWCAPPLVIVWLKGVMG